MTAFDGPGPFDGDAVFHYLDRASLAPAAFRDVVAGAFAEVIAGGAARRMPKEFLALAGLTELGVYADVDEAVWAWACAEMVALALGRELESPMPEVFAQAARKLPAPAGLLPDALRALDIASDRKRSELAGLLAETGDDAALQRLLRLRALLASASS